MEAVFSLCLEIAIVIIYYWLDKSDPAVNRVRGLRNKSVAGFGRRLHNLAYGIILLKKFVPPALEDSKTICTTVTNKPSDIAKRRIILNQLPDLHCFFQIYKTFISTHDTAYERLLDFT